MNDKWFNIAMIILFTSLVANGFVLMLVSFPHTSSFNPTNLHQSGSDYNIYKGTYAESINTGDVITNAQNDTYTPITLALGDPFGLAPLNMVITAFVGLELLLLTLGTTFTMFAILFNMIALIMFTVKAIMVAYFASVLIRMIFGGRQ